MVGLRKHAEAVRLYEMALAAMDAEERGGALGLDNAAAFRATVHANIAQCYLSQELYRRAVEAATESLRHDATHGKAFYRRCLAYKALKMQAEARSDLDALEFCRHELPPAEMA